MSQWIFLKGFVEEITLGLKGKQICLANGQIGHTSWNCAEKF
jgi:hypothetical protein